MINVGIAGLGFMGMIHYLAYQKAKGARVRAICEQDPARLAGDWRTIKGNFGPAGKIMDLGPIARYGRPFSRLDDDRARAWFASWWSSPVGAIRQFAKALKSMIALAYYDAPAIRARLEFHPDAWIAEVARRRLESYGVDIQRAEETVRAPDPLVPMPRRRRRA